MTRRCTSDVIDSPTITVQQRHLQQIKRALYAPRVVDVVHGGLMIAERIAANAEHLLGVPPDCIANDFLRVDVDPIALAAGHFDKTKEPLFAIEVEHREYGLRLAHQAHAKEPQHQAGILEDFYAGTPIENGFGASPRLSAESHA